VADLLALSGRYIDDGVADGPVSRVTGELSELPGGIAFVEAFSNVVAVPTNDGLVVFDTSLAAMAGGIVEGLRRWSDQRVHSIVYTHGHADHVGGADAFLADAASRGDPAPHIIGHDAIPARFARYRLTRGHNSAVNARQFGSAFGADGTPLFPGHWVAPSVTYRDQLTLRVGDTHLELRHGRGETDDHTWTWIPEHRAVAVGDFVIWAFPNAGNPQKVQRYPADWARALRQMAALQPELLLPAHGLPVGGADRVAAVLGNTATVLESLVDQTLALMNEGATLDTIVGTVRAPAELVELPYLQPTYDEPEFVVRNIWRLYGGWWDGNPARLKPPADAAVGAELARLAGGTDALATRARQLATSGIDEDLRLACHLIELAAAADPDDLAVHAARADIYTQRRHRERSLMARGVFRTAAGDSQAQLDAPPG
jgi:alkyl sulfatase BDS1-like metallo-beta-lactamase superfamily hydrolase